jgi:hypothetical protein
MASSGKKKTTMAKLTRESRLRERRLDKKARKVARKAAALEPDPVDGMTTDGTDGIDGEEDTAGDELDRSTPPQSTVAEVS